MSLFTLLHEEHSSPARTGRLELPHGNISTPVFMPVGTNGAVKALAAEDLREIGFDIILSNTYHLYLRPGMEVIQRAGGLHRFMNWKGNILTDSGGFQIFSLSALRKISGEGVLFRSHIDGSSHFISPEKAVEIQSLLGSDIQMQLDVCTPWGASREEAEKALETTSLWMGRAKKTWEEIQNRGEYQGLFFPIVQGNFFQDLRRESAARVIDSGSPGIAIGGLSVGEGKDVFMDFLAYTAALLPKEKPRYVMGIGTPEYILGAIGQGVDMFDCVFPTRTARNGMVFSRQGEVTLKKAENTFDFMPIDEECGCKVCREYSRAYLRHLFKAREILCSILASYHNLYFLNDMVINARRAIEENRFGEYQRDFLCRYRENDT
jgi:queuine tRNA-ribosyltransferase